MKVMIKERVEWKDVFTCGIEHCHSKIWEASFGNGTARPVKPSRLTVGSPLQSQRRRGEPAWTRRGSAVNRLFSELMSAVLGVVVSAVCCGGLWLKWGLFDLGAVPFTRLL